MIFKIPNVTVVNASITLSLRCPACSQRGTFEVVTQHDLLKTDDNTILGHRRCPNDQCKAHIFFARRQNHLLVSYPAERIDFDASSIPPKVLAAMEEAITCHASSCFVASAIMVRKCLEELCRDRKAKGTNLKERLRALGSAVILPPELLQGLDDLRLLGNDAAHVESEEYDQIGEAEVETAIEFTKEVLKAVFQYSALLERLRNLKKKP